MKYDVANRRIWFKGEILNVNDAKINVLAPTSQFGLNVFEGIPCYWNDEEKQLYAFRLDDHHDRLIRSAKLIQINNPYSKEEMKKALVDIVKANEYDENLSVLGDLKILWICLLHQYQEAEQALSITKRDLTSVLLPGEESVMKLCLLESSVVQTTSIAAWVREKRFVMDMIHVFS